MKKVIVCAERVLSLVCGLGAVLSLCSIVEGANLLFALVSALVLALAARGLSRVALRTEKAAMRAALRAQRASQRRARRRLEATAITARRPAVDLRVA